MLQFYVLPEIKSVFKDYLELFVTRYKDSPAIFGWELANEPRCGADSERNLQRSPDGCNPEVIGAWIEEMSSHLKQLDSNHMVTVGEEGFWAMGAAKEAANPGTGWASMTGQNFSANMAPAAIDFAAVHLWPDNWGVGSRASS